MSLATQYDEDGNRLFDVDAHLITSLGDLAIKRLQHIPDWYIDQLKDARLESANAPCGDFMRVCSIPVAIHEDWLRQGFDCTKEPIKAVVARLKLEDLDALMTTSKAL